MLFHGAVRVVRGPTPCLVEFPQLPAKNSKCGLTECPYNLHTSSGSAEQPSRESPYSFKQWDLIIFYLLKGDYKYNPNILMRSPTRASKLL